MGRFNASKELFLFVICLAKSEITYLSWLVEIIIMRLLQPDPVICKFKTQAKIHGILLAVQRDWIQDARATLVSSS